MSPTVQQWFSAFLNSRSHSKILHKRLSLAITNNSKGVQRTTDKIKTLPFHMLDSLHLHSYAKQTPHMLLSGTTDLAYVQLVLNIFKACWSELISCHSQQPVYSLTFVLMWTRVEYPASQTGVDIRIQRSAGNSQKGAPKQLLKAPFGTFACNFCFILKNM